MWTFPKFLNRKARRKPVAIERRFDAAAGGRRLDGFSTFGSAVAETSAAAGRIRSQGRYRAANDPFIVNAVGNWVCNLIGAGIVPTSQHPDSAARANCIAHFNRWAWDADADGRTDYWGFQSLVARTLIVDGECFVHIVSAFDGAPQLRIIPTELVDVSLSRQLSNGGVIVNGIEFDAAGHRVAYHVLQNSPSQWTTYAPPVRVDAKIFCILCIQSPLVRCGVFLGLHRSSFQRTNLPKLWMLSLSA